MDTTKNVFDVSPFLLLEASADSEAAHDGVDDERVNYDIDGGEDDDDDDDDIDESCSASSYKTSCVTWTSQRASSGLGFEREVDTVKEERDVGEEDDDEGEGEVNSYRRCGRSQRENLTVEMSEMDKSRIFWEACLAS